MCGSEALAAELSRRVRDDLIHWGIVDGDGPAVTLMNGYQASAGDLVMARKNLNRIRAGEKGRGLANRDILRIISTDADGSGLRVSVERLTRPGPGYRSRAVVGSVQAEPVLLLEPCASGLRGDVPRGGGPHGGFGYRGVHRRGGPAGGHGGDDPRPGRQPRLRDHRMGHRRPQARPGTGPRAGPVGAHPRRMGRARPRHRHDHRGNAQGRHRGGGPRQVPGQRRPGAVGHRHPRGRMVRCRPARRARLPVADVHRQASQHRYEQALRERPGRETRPGRSARTRPPPGCGARCAKPRPPGSTAPPRCAAPSPPARWTDADSVAKVLDWRIRQQTAGMPALAARPWTEQVPGDRRRGHRPVRPRTRAGDG